MIVLLRVGIGWQFLYEGVIKFDPAQNFSAESLLGFAKGPPAEMFYWMLPDIDGTERLEIAEVESGRFDADGAPIFVPTFIAYENAWKAYFRDYLMRHFPRIGESDAEKIANMNIPDIAHAGQFAGQFTVWIRHFSEWLEQNGWLSAEEAARIAPMNVAQLSEWIRETANADAAAEARALVAAKRVFSRYLASLRADASDEREEVDIFMGSRERFIALRNDVPNDATFEQERRWWQMMGYRSEAAYWTRKFDRLGNALQSDLGRVADLQLAGKRGYVVTAPEKELIPPHPMLEQFGIQCTIPPNPYVRSRMEVMNLGVTILLTAIGLCLILGFCTRLACLAGIAFLVNVLLVTWPVPGVYPPIPMVAGSAMVVSKDMVGLLAMSVLVMVPAGRWGGLDYFLWNYGGKQIAGLFCPCSCSKEKTNA